MGPNGNPSALADCVTQIAQECHWETGKMMTLIVEGIEAPSNYQPRELKACGKPTLRTVPRPIPRQICPADRFIPRRCQWSFDAANYLLRKKSARPSKKNQLDVLKQVEELPEQWKRKRMHQLMVRANVIPSLSQKRVLSGQVQSSAERTFIGNFATGPQELWDEAVAEDTVWKSKPRKKPLIGIMDAILDIPKFQPEPRSQSQKIDWSQTNFIAVAADESVVFYDVSLSQTLKPIDVINVYSLKWSNDGYKLAICSKNATIYQYNIVTEKFDWSVTCNCLETYNWECRPRCICWSYNDRYVVTTCRGLLSVFSTKDGECVNMVLAHDDTILNVSFSATYRMLVTSAQDRKIRVFLWPHLVVFLEIGYYESVKALAWHPKQSGLLCIGGGLGDASLSLWNVDKSDPLSYRRVPFEGAVESLAWNKISGELVVQWSYWEQETKCTVMPVLSSLDRIVDVIPVEKELPVGAVLWNSDHTQLGTQCDESFAMWNFFGNEYQYRHRSRKLRKDFGVKRKTSDSDRFAHFTIR